MPIDSILDTGSGGQAAVVLGALMAAHFSRSLIKVLDSDPARVGTLFMGDIIQQLSGLDRVAETTRRLAIGSNRTRAAVLTRAKGYGLVPQRVGHRRGLASSFAQIGAGRIAAAGTITASRSAWGDGCILNYGAVFDDVRFVGTACHLDPLSSLAGSVKLDDGVLVCAGARVLRGLVIGSEATIGPGPVVVSEIDTGMTVVGVPAREASYEESRQ